MPLTKSQLFYDTLVNPLTLVYSTPNAPWIHNEFVNHSLDLIALLTILPENGAPDTTEIEKFFFSETYRDQTRANQLINFKSLREQSLQKLNNEHFLLSFKRYALLRMIAALSQDDYEKITRLVLPAENRISMSREEYNEGLAVLARALKTQLAQMNGLSTNTPLHTPTDPIHSLKNLITVLKATQRKYAYYDNPILNFEGGYTQSLTARSWLLGLTLLTGVLVVSCIKQAVHTHIGLSIFMALAAVFAVYCAYHELCKLHFLHVECEKQHLADTNKLRTTYQLPMIEPEMEPQTAPSPVQKLYLKGVSFIENWRNPEGGYRPFTQGDEQTMSLLEDDEQNRSAVMGSAV
jgi:hypothetical protein